MLQQFENPFRKLYLWAVHEVLDLKAILEAFEIMDELEEKRRKLMKTIGMTDSQVAAMRPAQTSTAKSMFEVADSQAKAEHLNKTLAA